MADTTTNTGSDSATIQALHQTLINDQAKVSDLQNQYNQTNIDLNNATSALNQLNANYAWPLHAFQILHNAGKWGLKNNAGQYWSVDSQGTIYISSTSTAQYNTYAQQYADYLQQNQQLNATISSAQSTINNLQSADGKTGALVNAKAAVDADINNIANFVPTTTQGQADHAAALQTAAQISQNAAVISQQQAAQKASDASAAIANTNYASVTAKYAIWGGIALVGIALIAFFIVKFRKKSA